MVECRRECFYRPLVVAMPTKEEGTESRQFLRDLQLLPRTGRAVEEAAACEVGVASASSVA